jgi:hypothetical protein
MTSGTGAQRRKAIDARLRHRGRHGRRAESLTRAHLRVASDQVKRLATWPGVDGVPLVVGVGHCEGSVAGVVDRGIGKDSFTPWALGMGRRRGWLWDAIRLRDATKLEEAWRVDVSRLSSYWAAAV